jgi:hypothetical protein
MQLRPHAARASGRASAFRPVGKQTVRGIFVPYIRRCWIRIGDPGIRDARPTGEHVPSFLAYLSRHFLSLVGRFVQPKAHEVQRIFMSFERELFDRLNEREASFHVIVVSSK